MMAGLPIRMLDATGPGRIAFSRDAAGETLAIPLHPGISVDVREHVFMVATHSVAYDWFDTGVWFQTGSGDGVYAVRVEWRGGRAGSSPSNPWPRRLRRT